MTSTGTDSQLPTFGRLARRMLGTFAGALQNRVELFTVEFEEENDRVMKLVVLGVTAVFLAMTGVLLITGVIIFLVPEQYRVYAAGGFALLYLAGAGATGLTIKGLLQRSPFAESLNQIRKDAELLKASKNEQI